MNGNYTKHIYIGSQRIVSKLGDLDSYGSDPRRIEYAGANVDGAKVDYADKYKALQQTIKDRYGKFEVEYLGKDNDDYVNGQGFCCDNTPKTKSFAANDNPELFQYYYHSDHLGSSSLITNLDGEIVQHIEYVPFGEVFIEERNNTWNTPYLFNAKELDEETGLYYYGARYYDPRVSIWLSVDPLAETYPGISSYAYCALNPIKYIDAKGEDIVYFNTKGEEVYRTESKTEFRTFIQSIRVVKHPTESLSGWREVPMPKIIQTRTQTKEDVSGSEYQKNDYIIAARTGLFNQSKNNGLLQLYTEGGNAIPKDEAKKIPDLDPTLVKAVAIQETHNGVNGHEDILTSNAPGDWKAGEKLKSAYGMAKSDKLNVSNSLYYGLRMLASKGFRKGISVEYDNKAGTTTTTYNFKGWEKAASNFNGGGVAKYGEYVKTMVNEAKEPKQSDY